MEKHIRITGANNNEVLTNILSFLRTQVETLFAGAKNSVLGSDRITLKCADGSQFMAIIFMKSDSYSLVRLNPYSNNYTESIHVSLSSGESFLDKTTGEYNADITYDVGDNYFKVKRVTGAGDTFTLYLASTYLARFKSTDGEDEWYHCPGAYAAYGSTGTHSKYTNSFNDIANFAIPQGQVALFNPGSGLHFFENVYRYNHKVEGGVNYPQFTYQQIQGLGEFYVLPGGLLAKA